MSDLSYLSNTDPRRFDLKTDRPMMKAVVTTGNGGYEKLDYRDVPVPLPRKGEVLLKVLAAGINNTEINTRLGWYSSSVTKGTEDFSTDEDDLETDDGGWNEKTPFPLIQGTDCCGEVVETGDDVPSSIIGKRVLVRACMRQNGFDKPENIWMASDFDGAFAQYVIVPAGEAFAVQSNWSDIELATIPCAYGTAENMLQRAGVNSSDHVLVTGASGGVGSAAVQLAKCRGAQVTAIAGRAKIALMKNLGADRIIPREADLVQEIGDSRISVVVDNVAGEGFGGLIQLLSRGGRYVSSGAIAGPMVSMDMREFYLKDLNLIGCTAWDEPVFPSLIRYIEESLISPLVAKTYALEDIAAAQKEFMKKEHFGNFVLVPPQ